METNKITHQIQPLSLSSGDWAETERGKKRARSPLRHQNNLLVQQEVRLSRTTHGGTILLTDGWMEVWMGGGLDEWMMNDGQEEENEETGQKDENN